MNLTEQEKYTLIGSASGFVLSRIFGTGLFGSLVLVGIGGYAGYNSNKIKSFIESKTKSKNDLSYLAGGEKSTEDDAKKMIAFFNEKLNYSESQQKRFIEEYVNVISKKENDYLLKLSQKDESTYTESEKKLYSKLIAILNDIVIQKD
jgi:hypothetical protein